MSDKTTTSDTYTTPQILPGTVDEGLYVGADPLLGIGFYGTAPVAQQAAPTAVSTTTITDTQWVATINDIITKLTTLGLWA